MNIELSKLRLPLATFTLQVDVILSGRVTALFGASGAGKTSLLEIIAGLRRPATGCVRLDGSVLTNVANRSFVPVEDRGVGYVPQEGALFPHLSVLQNLLYSRGRNRAASRGLTLAHVTEILEITNLLARRIQTLSGGEKQRIALGRALLAAPRLLLLDEPLSGLDEPLRERLLPYLARVRDEFSIPMLYVTHSPDEVMALCDQVVVLSQGKVTRQGAPRELFAVNPQPSYLIREAGADEDSARVREIS